MDVDEPETGAPSVFNTALSIGAVFPPPIQKDRDPPRVESLDFHRSGRLLLSADSDSNLVQIDVLTGAAVKRFTYSGKHAVGIARYTHHEQAVLCTGRPGDRSARSGGGHAPGSHDAATVHDVRYLSLYDNSVQRSFHGHGDAITALSMCPSDDGFATGSKDRSVRIWNLKSSKALATLRLPATSGAPRVAYDPTGKVLAATYLETSPGMEGGGGTNIIKLYDARNYGTGPFTTFALDSSTVAKFLETSSEDGSAVDPGQAGELSRLEWTDLCFSPDESYLLVSGRQGLLLLLDAFDGNLVHAFKHPPAGPGPASSTAEEKTSGFLGGACFTPDGKHVVAAGGPGLEGEVGIWPVPDPPPEPDDQGGDITPAAADAPKSSFPVRRLQGHPGAVGCVACSPTYNVIASGCAAVGLWTEGVGGGSGD